MLCYQYSMDYELLQNSVQRIEFLWNKSTKCLLKIMFNFIVAAVLFLLFLKLISLMELLSVSFLLPINFQNGWILRSLHKSPTTAVNVVLIMPLLSFAICSNWFLVSHLHYYSTPVSKCCLHKLALWIQISGETHLILHQNQMGELNSRETRY